MLPETTKTDRLTDDLTAYMGALLNLDPKVVKLAGGKSLPLFLRGLYAFYRARILDSDFILMVQKDGEEQTPASLAKHMQKLRESLSQDVIFVNDAVSSLGRRRMIEQRIPFVIPGNQMYLPMLGLDLREHFRKIQAVKPNFSPSTQVLVLDALYHPRKEMDTPTNAAKRFGYSTMTMTRAFDELEQAGLGTHSVKGKERCLEFPADKKALWETALPFLVSPVRKKAYTSSLVPKGNGLKAGLSALAELSNLAPPDTLIIALEAEEFRRIQKNEIQMLTHAPDPDWMGIECWSYPRGRFGSNGLADPLSVYLSLKGDEDERVQSALSELLRGVSW